MTDITRRGFLGLFLAVPLAKNPKKMDLKLKDAVDTLAEYQLIHLPRLTDEEGHELMGFTSYSERTIAISDRYPYEFRKMAVVHELSHAKASSMGYLDHEEQFVEEQSMKIYRNLYK